MINIQKLREDARRIEEQIREAKLLLRTTWTRPMDQEQINLATLRAQATELYTLRAWLRGKLHRKNPPEHLRHLARDLGKEITWDAKEHAREIAERVGKRYQIEEEAMAS